MAGYTRQSLADIVPGLTVRAGPLNLEFNSLAEAFNGSIGHSHDGSTGQAPKIDLTTSVVNFLPQEHGGVNGRNNVTATTAPTISNDATQGYAVGSLWVNTANSKAYICVSNTINTAQWVEFIKFTLSGSLSLGGGKLTDVGAGTNPTDGVNLGQLQPLIDRAEAAADEAEASESSTEALYIDFQKRYLGAFAEEPTTDNVGNALIAGALYYDTALEVLRVYSVSLWRTIDLPDIASQLEAEEGTNNATMMTPLRTRQSIVEALKTEPVPAENVVIEPIDGLPDVTDAQAALAMLRAQVVAVNEAIPALASRDEAEAGTENTKAMTPLRVAQAIVAQLPPPLELGDILITTRDPGSAFVRTDGAVYLQSVYPELFALIGLDYAVWEDPVKIDNPATLPSNIGNGASWSPDNRYLAIAHQTTPFVAIYDWDSGSPVKIDNPGTMPTGTGNGASWSPDGRYLAIAHLVTPFVTIYDWDTGSPVKIDNPATLPPNTGLGAAWSPDGRYLAVTHSSSPFVTIYDWDSGSPVKIDNPAILPAGDGNGASWSPVGRYLAIAHTTTPCVTIYDWNTGSPVKIDNPAILPANTGNDASWSPDGRYLAIAHSTSPFVTIYDGYGYNPSLSFAIPLLDIDNQNVTFIKAESE